MSIKQAISGETTKQIAKRENSLLARFFCEHTKKSIINKLKSYSDVFVCSVIVEKSNIMLRRHRKHLF